MTLTLADVIAERGIDVLAHLDRQASIPVVSGPQCQGDLAVIPLDLLDGDVRVHSNAVWKPVKGGGVEVLRGTAMGNPHTLVAAPDTCRWTTDVTDDAELAIGVLDATDVAYLAHPEHGYAAIAPGQYVIRRQREQRDLIELVED